MELSDFVLSTIVSMLVSVKPTPSIFVFIQTCSCPVLPHACIHAGSSEQILTAVHPLQFAMSTQELCIDSL